MRPSIAQSAQFSVKRIHQYGIKAIMAGTIAGTMMMTGCQTVSGLFGDKDDPAVATASQSDAQYYRDAISDLDKGRYLDATAALTELRTFYPTGPYAEQALLDLMYSQFQSKEFEAAATDAEQFIRLYPNNPQVDYAYYVRGVANMQAGQSALISLAGLNQAHRDTGYMRLAFNQFLELITRYPNSIYAPDAAQRMSYIYNQFAENELEVARWYVKRDAPVAAANRAKWVFQYYPLSVQVPEAIAILAYSHNEMGLDDLADEYKTLLRINYPEWLNSDGSVRLKEQQGIGRTLLNTVTLGRLNRSADDDAPAADVSPYSGATKTQLVTQAVQLQLPKASGQRSASSALPDLTTNDTGIRIGLDLPQSDVDRLSGINSVNQAAIDSRDAAIPTVVRPDTAQTLPKVATTNDGLEVVDVEMDDGTNTNAPTAPTRNQ